MYDIWKIRIYIYIYIYIPEFSERVFPFNPPFTKSVDTDVGKKFLNLVKECFPKENVMSKIFNKNTIKITYSTLPSMGTRISGANKSKLKDEKEEVLKKCVCRKGICPVSGECTKKDTIYEAVITDSKERVFKYIGKTSTEFTVRYRNHKKAFKNKKYIKNCELSKKVWELKDANISHKIDWKIRKQAGSYKPGNQFCNLCIEEIHQIIFYNEKESLLNTRNELYKKCRHKTRYKLNQK